MLSKIHKSDIDSAEKYWYIYQGGGKCQLVHVLIDDEEFNGTFNVQISEDGNWYNSFPIKIDHDEDGFIKNLFLFTDKKNAEVTWCHYFIKDFRDNTFVDYKHFLELTQTLYDEYPELLLKGL